MQRSPHSGPLPQSNMSRLNTVNIRPGVNVLSVLPHLNYKAWYALAEFVDNSIQSSISRRKDLEAISGGSYVLRVDITFDADDGCERLIAGVGNIKRLAAILLVPHRNVDGGWGSW